MGQAIEKIFGSRTRAKVLSWFYMHSDESFFVRQIATILKEDSTNLSRELANLEKVGILSSTRQGNLKYFQANKACSFYDELKGLVLRMRIKRHDFIYEPERPIPRTEVTKSLESAGKFVKEIMDKIQKATPQKKLF